MFNKKRSVGICPFLKKYCIEGDCELYITVVGNDPQSGQPINESKCAIAWMPILQIETSKEARTIHAGLTNLRNETEMRQKWWVSVLDSLNIKKRGELK